MPWKEILKGFLGVLVPMLFSEIIGKYPDFPLNLDTFSILTLWIIGQLIGGWEFRNAWLKWNLLKYKSANVGGLIVKERQ